MSSERALLEQLIAGPVSGDVLARRIGQTRAAVWKRIEQLRAAGVVVNAQPGRGYALDRPMELLEPDAIRQALPETAQRELAALDIAWTVDSTNSELLRRPAPDRGAEALLAERQTGGRGRRGRAWVSPLAANLYLSVARNYGAGLARLGGLSLVAGVAVAEALHALGFRTVGLKWPNDLVVDAGDGGCGKLGGVLVEGSGEHAGPARAVIGIGLNVAMPDGAGPSDQPWTDLSALTAAGPLSRNLLATELLAHLLPALRSFDRDGLAPFLRRYAAFDVLQGRPVDVHLGSGSIAGTALGIAEDGSLRVEAGGSERCFHSGEVSVRRGAKA